MLKRMAGNRRESCFDGEDVETSERGEWKNCAKQIEVCLLHIRAFVHMYKRRVHGTIGYGMKSAIEKVDTETWSEGMKIVTLCLSAERGNF